MNTSSGLPPASPTKGNPQGPYSGPGYENRDLTIFARPPMNRQRNQECQTRQDPPGERRGMDKSGSVVEIKIGLDGLTGKDDAEER